MSSEIDLSFLPDQPQQSNKIDLSFLPDQPKQEKSFIGETISNVPESAMEFGKNVLTAVKHPIETAGTLMDVGAGAVKKYLPMETSTEQDPQVERFNSVLDFFKNRYGGIENAKQTMQKDPVGFLADLSAVFSLGGGITSKLGDVTKLSELQKAGQVASKVGEVTEPINLATKTIGKTGEFIGNRMAEGLGMTTGTGGEVIKQAFNNPTTEFKSAMRGSTTGRDLVEDAKGAFETVKEQRRQEYLGQLEKVKPISQTFEQSIIGLKNDLQNKLKNFGITENADGTLNFSRSTISQNGQGAVEEAINKIRGWGTQPEDFSVIGLDTLKRQLDDLIPTTGEARAFITPLRKQVRDVLVTNVPEYAKLVGDYEKTSNFLKDLGTGSLSLGTRAGTDTILRKLTQSLRQNFEFRQELLNKLDKSTGSNLVSEIAGQQLSSFEPRGLSRLSTVGGTTGMAYATYKGLLSYKYLPLLALASPRIVGEFVSALGLTKQLTNKLLFEIDKYKNVIEPLKKSAFQSGRIANTVEENQK